jgi:hypothetical protein
VSSVPSTHDVGSQKSVHGCLRKSGPPLSSPGPGLKTTASISPSSEYSDSDGRGRFGAAFGAGGGLAGASEVREECEYSLGLFCVSVGSRTQPRNAGAGSASGARPPVLRESAARPLSSAHGAAGDPPPSARAELRALAVALRARDVEIRARGAAARGARGAAIAANASASSRCA